MLSLKNNFIMAPIKLGYSDAGGEITERHLAFYAERNRHLGAITPEPLYIDKGLREIPTQIGIDSDNKLPGLQKLTATIKAHGTKAIAHLSHPGRMANPKIPGNYHLSSTDKACENGGATPKRMTRADMDAAIVLFESAARRAQKAGFDIIELQLGHGYLPAQFLSPAVNDRTDDYGGSFENRARFPMEIFDAVKNAVNLPVIVRISGEEMTPKGIKIDESIKLARLLETHGAAAIHVSAGTVCSTPPWFFQHMFVPKGKTWDFAAKIKSAVNIPLIFVGRINSAKDVNRLEKEYRADYIALGRAIVVDPDFVAKYTGELPESIRPCLACSEGCLGGVKSGNGLGCVVNPSVGHDDAPPEPVTHPKKFAVVGGGLAGMQAALTLKARGHTVEIYEKDRLGGQFNLAYLPPNKSSLKEIVDYFEYELAQADIPVIHKEATSADLTPQKYNAAIIATGAKPALPPIKGLDKFYWTEFLQDENLPENQTIAVIGGGLIGIEIASKLVDKNNTVIIVEMLDDVARGMEMIEKVLTLKKLKAKNVTIFTGTKVTQIDGDKVFIEGAEVSVLEGIDKIVVATGMQSFRPLADAPVDLPVHIIGDAKKVGKAQEAIRDGYILAQSL